jgi:hypothetical protein
MGVFVFGLPQLGYADAPLLEHRALPRPFRIPRPTAVEAVIGITELRQAFGVTGVSVVAQDPELEAACGEINAGLVSLVLQRDSQLERLQDIRKALLRIAGGDLRGIAAFTAYVRKNRDRHMDLWSLASDTPHQDDPVLIALRDAAASLPHLRAAGDAPDDDAPAAVMIAYLADLAAKAFGDGIQRYEVERAQQGRQRSAAFGQGLIAIYVAGTGRKPSFSRASENSPVPGMLGGPLIRFLIRMYELIREKISPTMFKLLPREVLGPSPETFTDWIKAFREDAGVQVTRYRPNRRH